MPTVGTNELVKMAQNAVKKDVDVFFSWLTFIYIKAYLRQSPISPISQESVFADELIIETKQQHCPLHCEVEITRPSNARGSPNARFPGRTMLKNAP